MGTSSECYNSNYFSSESSNRELDNEDNVSNEQSVVESNDIVLSVFWKAGKLGVAVYYMETSEIHLLNDTLDASPDFKIFKYVLFEVQPTLIVFCNNGSAFVNCVKQASMPLETGAEGEQRDISKKIKLMQFSAKNFRYDICKKRALDMKVMEEPPDAKDEDRMKYLLSLINIDYQSMVSALGALLFCLDRNLSQMTLRIPSQNILAVKMLNLGNLVWIDHETYNALEIFSPTNHPSTFKWTSKGVKEGFSLYSLMNRCCSRSGSRYLRSLMSHPVKDLSVLRSRHEVIHYFLKSEHSSVLKNVTDCLRGVSNVSNIILRIIGTQATPGQWKTFYKTIHNAIIISELCHVNSEGVTLFKEIGECLDDSTYILRQTISNIMDFEASEEQGRFIVKAGAVPDLDEIKEKQKELPHIMKSVALLEISSLPEEIESCSIIYLPEMGYLLAVPAWKEDLTVEELNIENIEFKFLLNGVAHYKTARCKEMDEILGDNHLVVLKHETEIMYQIVEYMQKHLQPVLELLKKITLLDCLISMSSFAKEYDLVQPEITDERIISITKGRHIMQQLCVNTFVPNDYHSSSDQSLVKIFTGPNSAGKSVYLKQVALIVYLAHIGSYIPAEKGVIGLVDHIHSRIQTTESIASQLSSFMIDLRQLNLALCNSTYRSLIVIDEFGKGTADVDGLSLLAASLKFFLDRESFCPHIVVSTHFHTLNKLLPESTIIKYQTLEYMIDGNEIIYLYKVCDGSVTSSFAHQAALTGGLASNIVTRAEKVLDAMKNGMKLEQDPENLRTIIMNRKKKIIAQLMLLDNNNEDEFAKIRRLLENLRF